MEAFSSLVQNVDDMIWSIYLVLLCLGAGLFLSIRMKFPQLRLMKDMVKLLLEGEKSEKGITPFQAFATTVGARVGMGNIAGIGSAIYFGGPGAIFWMWIIALIGAASAFTESVLAQAYKDRNPEGEYIGGPAYYIEKGMKCKPYAIVFALTAILGPGILLPGVQINSLAIVFEEAFSVNKIIIGLICCILLAFAVYGSIKRIAKIAEILAPFMCMIYITLALIIVALNVTKVPGVILLIIRSALGFDAVLGAIVGSAISWGVKRGIYSNEAGMGCGAIVSAATECSHPAKQGLVQAFSIYVDTLFVGTATALIILLTGNYDVTDGTGKLLIDQTNGLENGIRYTQHALMSTYGEWCGKLLAIIIVLFVFTSMTGYCYQAEANMSYLTRGNKKAINIIRGIFVLASFVGVLVEADAIWAIGDIGYGLMAWANIIAILILSPMAVRLLKDYEEKKKSGKEIYFDPADLGIEDKAGVFKKK